MTTRVLLTGASGFVGRQVLRALVARGAAVRVVARGGSTFAPEDRSLIERVLTTDDLFAESVDWWKSACTDVNVVVHTAWYAEPGKYVQSPLNMECLIGTLQMTRGVALAGVRRFVGIGSCAEYDTSVGTLTVETPLRPRSPYAAAKAASFLALSEWLPAQGVTFAWCRLFYLHGEGEDQRRLVPYVRSQLAAGKVAELSTGTQIRDFLDVRDAGCRIAAVALGDQQGPLNICSGVPVTVRELAEQVADESGRRDLLAFGAREDNPFDPPCVVGVPSNVETT